MPDGPVTLGRPDRSGDRGGALSGGLGGDHRCVGNGSLGAGVDHPGVQDIYIVRDAAGEEHWIPAVPEFVVDVDIAARTVKMRPIAGMFDEPVNGDEE